MPETIAETAGGINYKRSDTLLKIAASARHRARLQDDLRTQAFQPLHAPLLDAVLLHCVAVHGPQGSLRLSPLEQGIGDAQHRMPHSNQRAFLPPPGRQTPILCRPGGPRGLRRDMGTCNSGVPSPATPWAGLPAQAFPPPGVMAWTPPSPRRQMCRTGHATHSRADCRQQYFRAPRRNAGHGGEQCNRLRRVHPVLCAPGTGPLDRFIHVITMPQVRGEKTARLRSPGPLEGGCQRRPLGAPPPPRSGRQDGHVPCTSPHRCPP
jgi:hypothetical protein